MKDRIGTQAGAITCRTHMCFLDSEGPGSDIDADLSYDPADPYAVSVVFHTAGRSVTWTFGRELLADGLHEPVGLGDVQIWPCVDGTGAAVVVIELFAPAGDVMVQVRSRAVAGFVARMLEAVPLGTESVDVDGALAALL